MYAEEFPMCCGAHIVVNFNDDDGEPYGSAYVLRKLEHQKEETRGGMLFAILNGTQNDALAATMLKAGFKEVAKGINPLHGSHLHAYIWTKRPIE